MYGEGQVFRYFSFSWSLIVSSVAEKVGCVRDLPLAVGTLRYPGEIFQEGGAGSS